MAQWLEENSTLAEGPGSIPSSQWGFPTACNFSFVGSNVCSLLALASICTHMEHTHIHTYTLLNILKNCIELLSISCEGITRKYFYNSRIQEVKARAIEASMNYMSLWCKTKPRVKKGE